MKTIVDLVNKKAERDYNSIITNLESYIRKKLCIILRVESLGYLRVENQGEKLREKVETFVNDLVTEEQKKKYIEVQIDRESEKIMNSFESLQHLVERSFDE